MPAAQMTFRLDYGAIARMTMVGGVVDRFTGRLALEVAEVAKHLAPRKTGELADSIEVRRAAGLSMWTVSVNTDYALAVMKGSRPHVITPKNGKVLRFPAKGGTIVFTKHVDHPGNKPNPFLEKALLAVVGRI